MLFRFFFYIHIFFITSFFSANALYDPPALYLTWQQNPDTTMTIQWISSNDRIDDMVQFQSEDQPKGWLQTIGSHQQAPNYAPYVIHRVELINLNPNSGYRFRIGSDGAVYKFRTMPSNLEKPIRFVVGGDIFHDSIDVVKEMNRFAANSSPHFALAGGDLAYTSKKYNFFLHMFGLMNEKIERWLIWLQAWKETMVTPEGYLIPMIPTIGNHDSIGRFNQKPENAQYFYSLFAFPGEQGYNVLDFNHDMSLFVLDSSITHPVGGRQTEWLHQALEARQGVPYKFALYHIPAYPSVRKFTGKINSKIRQHWVPIFEQFGLTTAFEHHDHAYKRTHLIRDGKIDPKGVLYIGDGAWGVTKPNATPKTKEPRWYILKRSPIRHIIVVTVEKDQCHYMTLDDKGAIADEYTQPFIR